MTKAREARGLARTTRLDCRAAEEIALVYGELGELDRAFDYLDRAYAEHPANLVNLLVDPGADSLRQDPRFDELMKKLGLQ
jgi:tetratricopeptide (TPR) repeat protein